jgi:hypothetical protein
MKRIRDGAHPVRDGQVKIIRVRVINILLLFLVEMCSTIIIKKRRRRPTTDTRHVDIVMKCDHWWHNLIVMERHKRSKDDDNRLMSLLLCCDVVRVDHDGGAWCMSSSKRVTWCVDHHVFQGAGCWWRLGFQSRRRKCQWLNGNDYCDDNVSFYRNFQHEKSVGILAFFEFV